jgi:hypothetical protein
MRTKPFVAVLLIPSTVAATSVVGVRTQTSVIISADSKPTFLGGNEKQILPSIVSKIHQKGQVVFAIVGIDNDPNEGLYFQDLIANSFEESDPFTTKLSKAEEVVKEAVQKEIFLLQRKNQRVLQYLFQQALITGFVLADYSEGVPHLSARTFKIDLRPSPHLVVEKCGGIEHSICYSGPRDTWREDVPKVFGTFPDPLLATRTFVERDIQSFPENVGPPIVSVEVDKTGVRWFNPYPVGVEPLSVKLFPEFSEGRQRKSFLKTAPDFMTNLTRWSSVMSLRGSPETATRSAHFPFSMVPILSDQPNSSAAVVVAVRMACMGVMPYFT